MEFIISTGVLWPYHDVVSAIKYFAKTNIRKIEIYVSANMIIPRFNGIMDNSGLINLLKLINDLSIECNHVHAPMLSGDDTFSYRKRVQVLETLIKTISKYEINNVNLHPVHYSKSEEDLMNALNKGQDLRSAFLPDFLEIEKLAEECNIRFLIENIQHNIDRPLINTPKTMDLILKAFTIPVFINFDLDHTNPTLKAGFLQELGSKIITFQMREINENSAFEIKNLIAVCPNVEFITIEGQYSTNDLDSLNNKINSLKSTIIKEV